MTNITLQLAKLTCPSCIQKITNTVNDLVGVDQTKILFDASKARVIYDETEISTEEIIQKIEDIGYEAEKIN